MNRAVIISIVLLGVAASAGAAKRPEYREAKKLYKKQKYAAALKKLQVAAKKEPRRAGIRYLMGLTLSRLRRPVEAEAALLEAKRLDPAIGFTSRSKFQEKLQKAQRLAAALRGAKPGKAPRPRPAPMPVAKAPPAAPLAQAAEDVPAPPLPPPALSTQPAQGGGGVPLWALILLGVCGGFLGLSFLRELVRRGR